MASPVDNSAGRTYFNTKKELIVRFYRILFWTGYSMVLLASLVPVSRDLHAINIGPPVLKLHFDQLLHAVVYFIITLYYYIGNAFNIKLLDSNSNLKFFSLAVVLAILTELVQIAVPTRSFNYFDILWNISGILTGAGICSLILKKRG